MLHIKLFPINRHYCNWKNHSSIFWKSAKTLQLSNKFIVNIDDKHFKIGFSAIENTPVN